MSNFIGTIYQAILVRRREIVFHDVNYVLLLFPEFCFFMLESGTTILLLIVAYLCFGQLQFPVAKLQTADGCCCLH